MSDGQTIKFTFAADAGSLKKEVQLTKDQIVQLANATEAMRVKLVAAFNKTEEATKRATGATTQWTDKQQRASMAMASTHAQALKLNKAFDDAHKYANTFGGGLMKVIESGLAFGGAFLLAQKAMDLLSGALRAIPDEIGRVVAAASSLANLSAKTQMSTESLQRMKYAGSLVGVTLDEISAAALKAQRNLVENPKVFEKWGLSAKALRDLRPEEQLAAIADVIRQIPEPARQVAAAMDLMGKGGAANMALLRSDLHQVLAEADGLGVTMGDELVGHLDDVDDATTRLKASWEALKDKLVGGAVAASGADQFMNDLAQTIGLINQKAKDGITPLGLWVDLMMRFAGLKQLKDMAALLALANVGTPAVKGKGLDTSPDQIDFDRILENALKLTEDQVKEADKLAKARERAAEQAKKEAQAAKYTLDIQRSMNDLVDKMYDDIATAWMQAPTMNRDIASTTLANGPGGKKPSTFFDFGDTGLSDSTKALIADAEKGAEKWQKWGDSIAYVAHQLGGTLGGVIGSIGAMFDGLSRHQQQAAENLAKYGDSAMTTTQKVQAGMAAAGTAFSIYGDAKASKSPGKGALSGAGKGAAAGAAFGPYGMVIGAVVGAGIGFMGGKKGQAEELKQLNKQLDELMTQAKHAGVTLDHAFNPKSAKSLKQAILDLNEAMDMKPLQDEFNQLVTQARVAGIQFKETFDTHSADALKDSIDRIKRALDLQAEAQQKVQEAMDRYGITADQMGAAWQKQELDKQAAQLYQDWQLLNAAGADHTVLLEKMGPSVNEYVQAALKGGVEIPEAMKPIIDEMIAQHQLLDENGKAYGSAEEAGIQYGKTQSEMFDILIQKVTDLVNALLGIPSEVNTDVNVNKRVTEDDGTVTGGPPDKDLPHFAKGGRVEGPGGRGGGGDRGGGGAGSGVHVIVGEHEGETIVPDSQRGAYADAWGGGDDVKNEIGDLRGEIQELTRAIKENVKPGANITISPTIPVDSLGLSRNRADFFNEIEDRAAQGIRLGTSAMFRALQDRGVV